MIGLFLFIVFALVALAYALKPRDWQTVQPWVVTIGLVLGGAFIGAMQPYSLERIDVAHVGLRINLIGDERGMSSYQYKTGWVIYNSYTEEIVEIPSSQQHVEYKPVTVFTKGGFAAQIAPSFNYEIVPEHAGEMYVSQRKSLEEIRDSWLYTAAIGGMNDVVNRWAVDSIFNYREGFEQSVMAEVNKRVGKWFTLSQIRTNIEPPKELAQAITGKTRAIQEAQEMEAKKKTIEMQNLNRISAAKGDSAEAVIRAKGEAESMRIRKLEITPLYVEFLKVSTWDGKNPSTLVTNGSSTAVMVK